MAIITKNEELKEFVVVEKELTKTVFLPFVNNAQEKYLLRILGDNLLSELETAYADSINPTPTVLSPKMKNLLYEARKVVAPLAMYSYLAHANVRLSNNGAQKTVSENYEAVSNTEIYFARIDFLQQGYTGIASLYRFLNKNKSDYNSWVGSEGEDRYNEFFIRSAKEFSAHVSSVRNSDWIFELMTGYMRDVEQRYIQGALTFEVFIDLKTKRNTGNLSIYEEELLKKIHNAIAHHTYALAMKTPDLVDEINNITSSRAENFNKTRLESDKDRFNVISTEHENLGNAAISDCVVWLNKYASTTVFPIWFSSGKYKSPNPSTIRKSSSFDNDNANGTFFAM